MCVCIRLKAIVCVRCVSIPAYQVSCPLRKRREMKEKEWKEKGRDWSMRRRIERTSEDGGHTHKRRTAHTDTYEKKNMHTNVWMKYYFDHLFLLLSLFNPSASSLRTHSLHPSIIALPPPPQPSLRPSPPSSPSLLFTCHLQRVNLYFGQMHLL